MVTGSAIAGIALVALGMVLTPGPNMIYLVSRSLSQGWGAGFVSLLGTALDNRAPTVPCPGCV